MALVAFVLRTLEVELTHVRYHDILRAFAEVPRDKILLALLCTVATYAVLPGYDILALAYAAHPLPWPRVAYGSTIAYGISQTLGFPALTGGSVRVRLWSAWGLGTPEIARAVGFAATTFTFGVIVLAGTVGLLEPAGSLERLHFPVALVRALSAGFLAIAAAYAGWSLVGRGRVLRVGRLEFAAPSPRLLAGQFVVATLDWTLAALVLYVLLPDGHGVRFPAFVAAFLLSQSVGLASHVPGGLGVFETLVILQFGGTVPTESLLGALLAYRVIYYLLPFGVALALLVAHEARRQRQRLMHTAGTVAASVERWAEPLLPIALGTMTMAGGAILLFSGATPAERGRVAALVDVLPLGVVELSHFAASIAGAGLAVLGWALTRRLDAAYHLARLLLGIGIVTSLLKGLDYEEAVALAVVLALLTSSRDAFYRRSSLLSEPLTPGWVVAMVAVVGVSAWIALFSFKHVEYSHDLWWHFAARSDAPRALRASAGAAAALALVATARLLRHAAPRVALPTHDELECIEKLIPSLDETVAAVALLGDKHLMLSDARDGFLMYGVSGRSWVVLGDPLGPDAARRELAWRLREAADEYGARSVFYEVSARNLPLYIDLGLTLLKMGEEAVVPLRDFSLEGGSRRGLRRTHRDFEKAGATFDVVPAAGVPAILGELRTISDDWLAAKSTREKGFSLGRFDPAYLAHFPHAVVRVGNRAVAFANVWTGSGRELSVDLMRYAGAAPPGVMEFLFIELMIWGRVNGFERMSLGMAPLSGLEARALAPRWHRLGDLLYRYGEHFYNFRGLRAYKEKFDPVWQPRYVATPAGLGWPRVLADIARLISGGIGGLVTK